ncbi:MAG: iron-sulfur cluster assembly accessory protein [Deltaproteobacteria bacterium]|nr:iron-sulfur cluster assembly accessory protein [Deltaproteobacteria bacterium]
MIVISDAALQHMRELIAKNGDDSVKGIRIAVMAGGCSGLSYNLDFESEPELDDNVFGGNPPVYVDDASLGLIDGLSLDYIGGLNGKGLVFNNPKSVDTCGCGTSFSVQR